LASVSTYDPPRLYFVPASHDSFFKESHHRRIPEEGNSAILRSLYHSLVQNFPAHPEARPVGKIGANRRTLILKSNASKRTSIDLA
jgi:hypothetical protein